MEYFEDDDFYYEKLLRRSKGKCEIYARLKETYVEVKPQKKVNGITEELNEPTNNSTISSDIWYHVAIYIEPEDVRTFALINKQTAKLVNSIRFWRNLYNRYCRKPMVNAWNIPKHLQVLDITKFDKKLLRSQVIEALYYCYRPLKERLDLGYKLDWLLKRAYVTSWQRQIDCKWIVCFKFWNKLTNNTKTEETQEKSIVVDNWESLALTDEENYSTNDINFLLSSKFTNPYEGVSLLVICCTSFVPMPTQLAYSQQDANFRLKATRELLCKDMRGTNLELDFSDICDKVTITVKYQQIHSYKVVPWWHPKFRICLT